MAPSGATLLMGKEQKEYIWNLVARKLAGEATAEDLRDLENLLRDNPELHYPLQTITDIWKHGNPRNHQQIEQAEKVFSAHLNRMADLKLNLSAADDEVHRPASASFRRDRRRPIAGFAAAAILLAALGVTLYHQYMPKLRPVASTAASPATSVRDNAIATANGSRTHLTLPDGTRVWLNAGSRIDYPKNFGATSREANLTGEAFFDVAADPGKPFIIHARKIDILVLGTTFNIKSYPSDKNTEATLVRGSIEVNIHNKANQKIILKPNQKLVIPNDDSLSVEPIQHRRSKGPAASLAIIGKPTFEQHTGAMIETSWVDNKLIFQDETFVDLARQMERWYGVTIRFDDEQLGQLQFTGIFQKETIRQALDALRLTAAFDYTISDTEIAIHN